CSDCGWRGGVEERRRLDAAGLEYGRVVAPLQQIVQHLVLGDLTVVQPALRHVDRVRRAPPPVALTLVGGTGVARARHLVPLDAIEVTPQPGAALDLRPPDSVDRGRREGHGTGRGE